MKVFKQQARVTDFQKLVGLTQAKVQAASDSQPKELVAVKGRMGGYEMRVIDIPAGQKYVLAR